MTVNISINGGEALRLIDFSYVINHAAPIGPIVAADQACQNYAHINSRPTRPSHSEFHRLELITHIAAAEAIDHWDVFNRSHNLVPGSLCRKAELAGCRISQGSLA